MKNLLFFLTLMIFVSKIQAQNFTYKDNFGNKYVYNYNKKSIHTKFDTIFLKTEIIAEKLGLKNDTNQTYNYYIWSIKKISFSKWHELILGLNVKPKDKEILGSNGGVKIRFKIKKVGEAYKITKTKYLCAMI